MAVKNIKKKRTVDNWKKKKWYNVTADPIFDSREIGKTIALDSKHLIGRTIKKTFDQITKSIKDSAHILTFKITKVTAGTAETELIEFNTKGGNLKRMIRRGKSKIDSIIYIDTKDGKKLKLKIFFITGTKYTTQLRREARNQIAEFYTSDIKEKTLKEAWNTIVYQKLTDKAKKKLVKLGYVNKVIVARAKLI